MYVCILLITCNYELLWMSYLWEVCLKFDQYIKIRCEKIADPKKDWVLGIDCLNCDPVSLEVKDPDQMSIDQVT